MKKSQKLSLNKEAIKLLSANEMATVGGGSGYSDQYTTTGPNTNKTCPTFDCGSGGGGTSSNMDLCDTIQ